MTALTRLIAGARKLVRNVSTAVQKLNGGVSSALHFPQMDPTYALIFVERRGPRFRPLWQVRDGPRGVPVIFACRTLASGYAQELLDGRRGQIIWA